MESSRSRPPRAILASLPRLARTILLGLAAVLAWMLVPPWFDSWYSGLAHDTRRSLVLGFLRGLLTAYSLAWVVGTGLFLISVRRLLVGRRLRLSRPWSARMLAVSFSTLLGLLFLETAAWYFHRVEQIRAGTFPPPPRAKIVGKLQEADSDRALRLLVIGESSAVGEPYQFWTGIGQIAAWIAQKSHPERAVKVTMGARGGAPISSMAYVLRQQKERPDLVMLYCGHNEFQSRCPWDRTIAYYPEDFAKPPPRTIFDRTGDLTPFYSLMRDLSTRQRLDIQPPKLTTRRLIDRPCCSEEEYVRYLDEFSTTLESIIVWCEQAGAVPVVFLPAGNEGGFEPNRSILDPRTSAAERARFEQHFQANQDLEDSDPDQAIRGYRSLLETQPGFAETHFRLARLLQARGEIDEARDHYTQARDLDGLPLRCPRRFQDVYRDMARRHPRVILLDARPILEARSPSKLLDDNIFHDGQHPTLAGYAALAEAMLNTPRIRAALGMAPGTTPPIDLDECARHFGMDLPRWSAVCERTYSFWNRVTYIRHEPTERHRKAEAYLRAFNATLGGHNPEQQGIPGLGIPSKP